ncbi:hypothetical protein AYO44_05300 [Planctomycetaceae bacterium SCGC AG-212-F19]|nr:hypothetical protein AYO44_05300 [Planctomycetaceae bacterium SCGC AG-212-F19]
MDFTWQPGVDLLWDLSWRLPFPDQSLLGIYTEHCLEHLPLRVVVDHVLAEFLRVLKPGGRLRVIVPDGGLFLRLYIEAVSGKVVQFPWHDDALVTPMMQVNRCFRDHGHLFAYDFDTLRHFLLKAGFSAVEHRSFHDGGDPQLLLDSPERAPESVFVEAIR